MKVPLLLTDTTDIFLTILRSETKVLVQTETNVVTIETVAMDTLYVVCECIYIYI